MLNTKRERATSHMLSCYNPELMHRKPRHYSSSIFGGALDNGKRVHRSSKQIVGHLILWLTSKAEVELIS
jgi:hypothetical protein